MASSCYACRVSRSRLAFARARGAAREGGGVVREREASRCPTLRRPGLPAAPAARWNIRRAHPLLSPTLALPPAHLLRSTARTPTRSSGVEKEKRRFGAACNSSSSTSTTSAGRRGSRRRRRCTSSAACSSSSGAKIGGGGRRRWRSATCWVICTASCRSSFSSTIRSASFVNLMSACSLSNYWVILHGLNVGAHSRRQYGALA